MGRRFGALPLVTLLALAPMLGGCSLLLALSGEGPSSGGVAPPTPVTAVETPGPASSIGSLPSPSDLAALLGPDDFAAAGIAGAGAPSFDANGEAGSVYAVYAGLSSGAGGIEMDVFDLGSVTDAAAMVYDPGLYAIDPSEKQAIGADCATFIGEQPTNDGTSTYDTLWVQKGRLVAALGVPTGADSRAQLLSLATLVLSRSAAYQ